MPKGVYSHKPTQGFQKGHKIQKGGKLHHEWKGEHASYDAKHKWLKHNFGKADRCENKNCEYPRLTTYHGVILKPKRYEWALLKGEEHDHKRESYIRLCASCHRTYDNGGKIKYKLYEIPNGR